MKATGTLLAAVGMMLAAPVAATVQFNVSIGSPVVDIPGNNDFQSQLAGLGLTKYTSTGASISLTGNAILSFAYMGSESGFQDSFSAGGPGGVSYTETDSGWNAVPFGSDLSYTAGAINDWVFNSSGGATNRGIGTGEFGIFIPRDAQGNYLTNVLYLGFDDQLTNIDDDHDDIVIRVTALDGIDPGGGAVPEPATWAMLVTGFGMVGSMRRRRPAIVAA
ncbi:MAG: PEPxxWA-CTERM sorting domain-containing protein [Sphingomonadales bacterium]|jgi:hypothetical protein